MRSGSPAGCSCSTRTGAPSDTPLRLAVPPRSRPPPGSAPTRRRRVASPAVGEPVSVLILNYNAPVEALKRCVASVEASDYDRLAEIVIAENGSTRNTDAACAVAAEFPRARVVDLGRNWGFSGGINRGIAACTSPWVFILNNDTEVDPHAICACAEVLAAQPPGCLGVVPKLLFLDNRHLIDAVGNAIDAWGAAFNVGIGQLDVGQYD
ncbi:MAG: hypothetical protein C4344_04275, partial [Acidimicrobiia bacterium]